MTNCRSQWLPFSRYDWLLSPVFKCADRVLNVVLGTTAREPVQILQAKRILISKPDHLGDLLTLVPALTRLRELGGGVQIELLIGEWNTETAQVLARLGLVDGWVIWNSFVCNRTAWLTKRMRGAITSFFAAVFEIRKRKFDLMLDFRPYSPNGLLLGRLAGIKTRAGFATRGFGWTLHHAFSYDPAGRLAVVFESNLSEVGCPSVNPDSVTFEQRLQSLDQPEKYHIPRPFLVLHATGGRRFKDLPQDAAQRVVSRLLSRWDVVILGAQQDEYRMPWLIQMAQTDGVHNLVGKTTIGDVFQMCLASCGGVVVDSFVAHILTALGRPVVLFSSSSRVLHQFFDLRKITHCDTIADLVQSAESVFVGRAERAAE